MDNLLRKVESDEVVVYTDQVYSIDVLNKCREIHQKLVDEGKIESDFDSDKWMGYSGVKKFGMVSQWILFFTVSISVKSSGLQPTQ